MIGQRELVASVVYAGKPVAARLGVRTVKGGRVYRNADYVAYQDAIYWLMREELGHFWNVSRYKFALEVKFAVARRKIDLDNLLVPVLNAGKGVIWEDDSQVVEIHAFKKMSRIPQVKIAVYIVGEN
jgi:Holliday junction resolvase RusA-like endonuclease